MKNDPAVAAIKYALDNDYPCSFLRLWMEGDFDTIREEWENVPDAVFIGADPLFEVPERPWKPWKLNPQWPYPPENDNVLVDVKLIDPPRMFERRRVDSLHWGPADGPIVAYRLSEPTPEEKLRKAAMELNQFIHNGMHFNDDIYKTEMIRLVGNLNAALETQ